MAPRWQPIRWRNPRTPWKWIELPRREIARPDLSPSSGSQRRISSWFARAGSRLCRRVLSCRALVRSWTSRSEAPSSRLIPSDDASLATFPAFKSALSEGDSRLVRASANVSNSRRRAGSLFRRRTSSLPLIASNSESFADGHGMSTFCRACSSRCCKTIWCRSKSTACP